MDAAGRNDSAARGAGDVDREKSMAGHLGSVAAELREAAGCKTVHIAAAADVVPSTIDRFEKKGSKPGFPHNTDKLVDAYSRVLGIPAIEFWRRAIERWAAALGVVIALAVTVPGVVAAPPAEAVHNAAAADARADRLEAARRNDEKPPARSLRSGRGA
jgi:hypothetical protein